MADYAGDSLLLAVLMTLAFCSFQSITCFEYQVGGTRGWVVPPANDSKIYNDWASENRFRPGDTLRFKYTKDSVMEVTETDYKNCNSYHPTFFSNTGNTIYNLNHSGAFYFISGVSGHCLKGERMIVKVLSSDESETSHGSGSHSSAADFSPFWAFKLVSIVSFVVSYVV